MDKRKSIYVQWRR